MGTILSLCLDGYKWGMCVSLSLILINLPYLPRGERQNRVSDKARVSICRPVYVCVFLFKVECMNVVRLFRSMKYAVFWKSQWEWQNLKYLLSPKYSHHVWHHHADQGCDIKRHLSAALWYSSDIKSLKSFLCLLSSVPGLRPLMDVNYLPLTDMRIARTFCFTNLGQAMYLCSPTEIQRITYSQDICENLQVSSKYRAVDWSHGSRFGLQNLNKVLQIIYKSWILYLITLGTCCIFYTLYTRLHVYVNYRG